MYEISKIDFIAANAGNNPSGMDFCSCKHE